jgi:hypothetical protein
MICTCRQRSEQPHKLTTKRGKSYHSEDPWCSYVREKERAVLMEGKTYLLPQADRTKWSMRRNEAESASEVETAAAACATWRNRTGARWGQWRRVGGGGVCPMHALEAVDAAAAAAAASVVVFRVMSPPTSFFPSIEKWTRRWRFFLLERNISGWACWA